MLVPLLLAARVSPVTTGAALLLGSSIGGELLNPGAPELRTVSSAAGASAVRTTPRRSTEPRRERDMRLPGRALGDITRGRARSDR